MKVNLPRINRAEEMFLKLPTPELKFHRKLRIFFAPPVKKLLAKIPVQRGARRRASSRYYKVFYPASTDMEGTVYPGHYPAPNMGGVLVSDWFVCPHGRLVTLGGCKDAKRGVRVVVINKPRDGGGIPKDNGPLHVYILSSDAALLPVRIDGGLGCPGKGRLQCRGAGGKGEAPGTT